METIKLKKIAEKTIEQSHPAIYDVVVKYFRDIPQEKRELIYDLVVQSVLKSGGDIELFTHNEIDDLADELSKNNEFYNGEND